MSLKLSGVALGNITGGPSSLNLYELADVSIVSPLTGQYLRYNSTISEWQNSYINTEVYNFLDTNLLSTDGVGLTKVSGPQTVTIGLGNITPISVSASGTVNGSNLSGSNTGDQTITLTGDVTGSGTGSFATTLATVNASPQTNTFRKITVNGKGLTTATSAVGASDITTALTYTPVNLAGDTMTGLLILSANPSGSLGAATKQYVDTEIAAVASGVNVHASCETATTAVLAACTYDNGTGGVGATLTANANGPIGTIGGYAIASTGKRILVKDQASQIQNGIYDVTQLGVAGGGGSPWILTRSSDFDGSPESEVQAGDMTFVQEGTLSGTQWIQTNVGTGVHVSPAYDYVIVGTDNIIFTQFAGAGTYTAGTGINISTNTISNTGVLSNVAGTGISVSSGTGNVTVTNTGVTSAVAGTNIAVSAATGAVTFSLTGTVPLAANIAGGAVNQIPFQSAASTTTFNAGLTYTVGTNTLSVGTAAAGAISAATGQTLQISSDVSVTLSTNGASRLSINSSGAFTIGGGTGSAGQVLISNGNAASPAWSSSPTLSGANFTSIPNSSLTNSSLTIGSTNIALGATSLTLAGLTSVTSGSFIPSSATVPTNGLYLSAANTVALATATTARFSINSTGNVVIAAPTAGTAITITALAGAANGSTINNITAGATTDYALNIFTGSATTGFIGVGNSAVVNTALQNTLAIGTQTAHGFAVLTSNTERMRITSGGAATFTGSIDAVSFNATSTKRVKKAIKNIGKTYLDKFASLKPREYDRKDYKAHEFGFVAEEMALVYPEIVGYDEKNKPTGIDYGRLSAILTAKVQEQQSVIDKLQAQMAKVLELLKV